MSGQAQGLNPSLSDIKPELLYDLGQCVQPAAVFQKRCVSNRESQWLYNWQTSSKNKI